MSGRGRGRRIANSNSGTTLNERFSQMDTGRPTSGGALRGTGARRAKYVARGGNSRFNNVMARRTGAPSNQKFENGAGRGRGPRGRRGRENRRGRPLRGKKSKLSSEALDKELESYMLKNDKYASSSLDQELDTYMKERDSNQGNNAPAQPQTQN